MEGRLQFAGVTTRSVNVVEGSWCRVCKADAPPAELRARDFSRLLSQIAMTHFKNPVLRRERQQRFSTQFRSASTKRSWPAREAEERFSRRDWKLQI
jgi:hypothetical protein